MATPSTSRSAPRRSSPALDWPGWARVAKTEEEALEALAAYAERYRPVAEEAGVRFPKSATGAFSLSGDGLPATGRPWRR